MSNDIKFNSGKVLVGNCVERLRELPDGSIDSIVTDPPYELGFMGKKWDASGVAYNVELWAECLRVLKPGGHLLAFGGTRTYHRMAVAIEDAGFEIRDSIHWVYGSGFPKSLNLKDKHVGWGTALKPAHEPIVLARKPLDGTVAANVQEHGTGALNIDGCRIGRADGDTSQAGNRTATFGTQETSSGGDGSGGWEQNSAGRWPANIIFDEAAGAELDAQSGIRTPGHWTQTKTTGFGEFGGGTSEYHGTGPKSEAGGASRFFYCPKPGKKERNAGLDGSPTVRHADRVADDKPGGNNPRNRTNKAKQNFHPTVKPVELMRYLVRLVTPPNGIVLDPFLGSGTTAVAAILEGFQWIGCEMTADYLPIITGRVNHAENPPKKTTKKGKKSQQLSLENL